MNVTGLFAQEMQQVRDGPSRPMSFGGGGTLSRRHGQQHKNVSGTVRSRSGIPSENERPSYATKSAEEGYGSLSDPPTNPDVDGPVQVYFDVNVINLHSIDEVEQSVKVDFTIAFYWNDMRPLMIDEEEPDDGRYVWRLRDDLTWDDIWTPAMELINVLEDEQDIYYQVVQVDGNVWIVRHTNYFCTLRAPMDLHRFPFDSQILPVIFRSREYQTRFVQLRRRPHQIGHMAYALMPEVQLPQFDLRQFECRLRRHDYLFMKQFEGEENTQFYELRLEFEIARQPEYYITKIISLYFIMMLMACTVFFLDPADTGARTSISMTIFLSAVAFHFVTNSSLPKVPYSTRMDKFTVFVYVCIFASFVENIAIFRIANRVDDEDAVFRYEMYFLAVFGGSIMVAFAWFLFPWFIPIPPPTTSQLRDPNDPCIVQDRVYDAPPRSPPARKIRAEKRSAGKAGNGAEINIQLVST